jgi:hypothetical protein
MKAIDNKLIFEIHPLTSERWGDLVSLFGPHGADGGCWCMYWRLTRSQFDSGRGESNRQAFKKVVETSRPVGLFDHGPLACAQTCG